MPILSEEYTDEADNRINYIALKNTSANYPITCELYVTIIKREYDQLILSEGDE